MKTNKKITFLTTAALTALSASLLVNGGQTVNADTVNNNDQAKNNAQTEATQSQDQTEKQLDQDVANAKTDVAQKQTDVETATKNEADAKQNVANAQTDLDKAKAQKPAEPDQTKETQATQNVANAENQVAKAKQNVANAQNDQTAKQNAVDTAKQNLTDKQTEQQTAQASAKSATNAANKAKQAVDTKKQELNKNHADEENTNRIVVSQSYKDAVKKYNDDYVNTYAKDPVEAWNNAGMNRKDFDDTMRKASADSWKMNHYVSNKKDESVTVDLDNITNEQQDELNKYAYGLLEDVRQQVGAPELALNTHVHQMANDIAARYVKDGRANADGQSHDYKGINDVAKQYGYESTDEPDSQFYENMAGFDTQGKFIDDASDASQAGWYVMSRDVKHTVTMDLLKHGIFYDLSDMLFNDKEWYHAYGLLQMANYAPENGSNNHFGFSISMLPNKNHVTTHYITVSDSDALDDKGKALLDKTDVSAPTASQVIAKANADSKLSKQDQIELDNLQKDYQAKQDLAEKLQTVADNAEQAVKDAQEALTNAENALKESNANVTTAQNNEKQAEAELSNAKETLKQVTATNEDYAKALKSYQDKVTAKETALTNAQEKHNQAIAALTNAKKALTDAQAKLKKAETVQAAYKQAQQAKAEQAKKEADAKAKEEAEKKSQAEADAKVKEEAEKKAQAEADAKAKEEAEKKAQAEADAKVKEEAEKAKDEAKNNQTKITDESGTKVIDKSVNDDKKQNTATNAIKQDTNDLADFDLTDYIDGLSNTETTVNTNDRTVTTKSVDKIETVATVKRTNNQLILTIGSKQVYFIDFKSLLTYLKQNLANGETIAINSTAKLAKNAVTLTIENDKVMPISRVLIKGTSFRLTALKVIDGHVYARIGDSKTWFDTDNLR